MLGENRLLSLSQLSYKMLYHLHPWRPTGCNCRLKALRSQWNEETGSFLWRPPSLTMFGPLKSFFFGCHSLTILSRSWSMEQTLGDTPSLWYVSRIWVSPSCLQLGPRHTHNGWLGGRREKMERGRWGDETPHRGELHGKKRNPVGSHSSVLLHHCLTPSTEFLACLSILPLPWLQVSVVGSSSVSKPHSSPSLSAITTILSHQSSYSSLANDSGSCT